MILAEEDEEDHQEQDEEQEQPEASLVVARTRTKKEKLAAAAEPESFHQSLFAMDAMIQDMIPKQVQDEREAFAKLLQHGSNKMHSNKDAGTVSS